MIRYFHPHSIPDVKNIERRGGAYDKQGLACLLCPNIALLDQSLEFTPLFLENRLSFLVRMLNQTTIGVIDAIEHHFRLRALNLIDAMDQEQWLLLLLRWLMLRLEQQIVT